MVRSKSSSIKEPEKRDRTDQIQSSEEDGECCDMGTIDARVHRIVAAQPYPSGIMLEFKSRFGYFAIVLIRSRPS
jgi:hypothetical protein